MRNFSSIAQKYLKVQKKRTILTCIGIILSVALITGSGTVLMSMWDKFYRDAVADTGDFYAKFVDVSEETADIIKSHTGVESFAATQDTGYAIVSQNAPEEIPKYKYFSVKAYDGDAFSKLPVKLVKGRLPQNGGEIVLEKRSMEYLAEPLEIGDSLSLEIGQRTDLQGVVNDTSFSDQEQFVKQADRQYTLVGLVEYRYSFNPNLFYALSALEDNAKGGRTVYVKLDSQVNIRDNMRKIAKDAGLDGSDPKKLVFNDELLRYLAQSGSDNTNDAMISLAIYVIVIIMLATIAVIYNAFNISVLERVSQFGLFRCIGATPAQIRGVVIKEAMILALIGIPIGIVCGTFAMALVFEIFKSLSTDLFFTDLRIVFSPLVIAASAALGLITIYLSARGPARKASKVSPMEAVRNLGAYKKEKRKTRRSRLGRKLFGVQGFLAWRNLGRNKKRVRITVLSMVISIVLFIVISSFMHYSMMSGVVKPNEYSSLQIRSSRENGVLLTDGEYEAVRKIAGVKNVFQIRRADISVEVPTDSLNAQHMGLMVGSYEKKGDTAVFAYNSLKTIGDDTMGVLNKYLKEGEIDIAKMDAQNGVILIKTVSVFDSGENKPFVFDLAGIKTGDTLKIGVNGLPGFTEEVKVVAVLNQNVLDANYTETCSFAFITTEAVYGSLSQKANQAITAQKTSEAGTKDGEVPEPVFDQSSTVYVQMEENTDAAAAEKEVNAIADKHPGWQVMNYDEYAKNQQSTILIMSILFYGFIAIIALIGALNIINTISTNIILRTRELSVLKAIGMTRRGIGALVYLESIYYSILAAVIGGIAGVGLSWLLFRTGGIGKSIEWTVPWGDLFIALAGSAFVCLVSGILPLKRVNRGAIMESISKEQ